MPSAADRLLKLHVLPLLIRTVTRALGLTVRYEIHGGRRFRAAVARNERLVGAVFHGRQPCFTHVHSRPNHGPWTVLCSRSLDGEMQHRILSGLGYRTIRGSSGRGASRALVDLIRALRSPEHPRVVMAVDGSRGPIYRLKPGVIALARKGGGRLQLLAGAARDAVVLGRTWDRMHIPRPFDRVVLIYAPPIAVPARLPDAAVEPLRAGLEDLLLRMQRRAEQLAGSRHV